MSIIIPANTLATGGFEVANSARFNNPSSDYLNKSFGNGNRKTFTISAWVKRSNIAGVDPIFSRYTADSDAGFLGLYINSNAKLNFTGWNTVYITTNRLFRDLSAWYHIVLAVDTTQSTNTNRWKLYINGVQETSFATAAYPNQNTDLAINQNVAHMVGRYSGNYLAGYMSEVVFIDGLALAPDQFGEFDEDSGIWKPIDVSGLTFGTNGFYLNFQTSAELGDDVSGNTNDFSETNLTAIDQTTDTCTNNFCTWNPLDTFYNTMTFQEGNTQGTKPNSTVESYGTSTFGITSGKWYAEFKVISFSGSNSTIGFGIIDRVAVQNDKEIGKHTYGISYKSNGDVFSADGNLLTNQGTLAANDIIGLYIDIDNLKFYFAKNGTIANSGTGLAIPALTSTLNGVYFFGFDNFQAGGSVHQANWGNPAYTGTDKADANGFGSFEYDPSSGTFDSASKDFLALCTKNLAEYGG